MGFRAGTSYPLDGVHLVSGLALEIRANAVDDVGMDRVDFYVDGQLAGTDFKSPFALVYETPSAVESEQSISFLVIATDSYGHQAESNEVVATLGKDEDAPVINLVSPTVDAAKNGDDVARIVESSEFVLKIAGYDNVRTTHLRLTGIKKISGLGYVLTGDSQDVLEGDDLIPQEVPGGLNAYSALKLVNAPVFSRAEGVEYDSYLITATASDKVGNTSTVEVVVGVIVDTAPTITNISLNKDIYFSNEVVKLDLVAKDDKAVSRVDLSYTLGSNVIESHWADTSTGLVGMSVLQYHTEVDLNTISSQACSLQPYNCAFTVTVTATVTDSNGAISDAFVTSIDVVQDNFAPLVALVEPVKGAQLYKGREQTIRWRISDETNVGSVSISVADSVALERDYATQKTNIVEDSMQVTLSTDRDEFVVIIEGKDIFGNSSGTTSWVYPLINNTPPTISIRHPAPGSRLVEGERYTLNLSVTDDDQVVSVEVYYVENGVDLLSHQFSSGEISNAIKQGSYLSAAMQTPTLPEGSDVEIQIRAVDNDGLQSIEILELEILQDEEPPVIVLEVPNETLSLFPGDSFEVHGTANDNYYLTHYEAVLVSATENEIVLPWEVFSSLDRIEQKTVDNKTSFGSVIVAERLYGDYQGVVRIPIEMTSELAGNSYQFMVRVRDNGPNYSESNTISLNIKTDTEAPTINLISPPEVVYDRQLLSLSLQAFDNIRLQSVSVSMQDALVSDAQRTILYEVDNIASDTLVFPKISDSSIDIDLQPFVPIPVAGKSFAIRVEAIDLAGNIQVLNRAVRILPDQPPLSSIDMPNPEGEVTKAQISYSSLAVLDDSVSPAETVNSFAVYTSFVGLGAGGSRDPTGHAEMIGAAEDNNVAPSISLSYPESTGTTASLLINTGEYLSFANSRLTIFPNQSYRAGLSSIEIVGGDVVSYDIIAYNRNVCSAQVNQATLLADSMSQLHTLIDSDTTTVIVTPNYDLNSAISANYIRKLVINIHSLSRVNEYTYDQHTIALPIIGSVEVILEDEESGQISFISSGNKKQSKYRGSAVWSVCSHSGRKAYQSIFSHRAWC
ncbi:MAG: hypothetical protein JKY67_20695 [Pseudomonadales bacterium]|nr:hypothetical protein [Pseudomonadales bacterium]